MFYKSYQIGPLTLQIANQKNIPQKILKNRKSINGNIENEEMKGQSSTSTEYRESKISENK